MKTPIPHDDHTFVHLDCQLCWMQEVGRLHEAHKQLTVQYRVLTLDRDGLLKRFEKLEAENAELRAANAAFAEADRKQNDELGWFGRREALVEAIKAATNLHAEALATLALQEWEEINPKPGAGT
jgi:hypothetical protein